VPLVQELLLRAYRNSRLVIYSQSQEIMHGIIYMSDQTKDFLHISLSPLLKLESSVSLPNFILLRMRGLIYSEIWRQNHETCRTCVWREKWSLPLEIRFQRSQVEVKKEVTKPEKTARNRDKIKVKFITLEFHEWRSFARWTCLTYSFKEGRAGVF